VAAPTLMVWLPGAFHTPEDFIEAGFEQAVRRRNLSLDLEFLDLELEHVGDRRVIGELAREIIAPARAAGCRRIWIGGISLGGYFALDYAASAAGPWDGLCLLAPYLGNRLMTGEIAAARSLADWQPGPLADSDEERRIWRFIQGGCDGRGAVYLGFGREDRFAAAHELFARALPAFDAVEGGHDWRTWSLLFGRFLDSRLV
jgi:pimeloyl-ACP methyl ester carboxylesterase